jgi:hypothetical protein
MQLNLKNYQLSKTKNYLRKNNFLLLAIGANQNAQNWLTIEQGLHKLKLKYYKTYNNTTKKTIKNSIYTNSIHMVNSTFFLLAPQKKNKNLTKTNFINTLNSILFTVMAIKLNKKVYSISQSKNLNSFDYKKNVSIAYQFLLTNLKFSYALGEKK